MEYEIQGCVNFDIKENNCLYQMNVLKINNLPEDIVGEIMSFMCLNKFAMCNKHYWFNTYHLKISYDLNSRYYRFLLRNDYSFIFNTYLALNFPKFLVKRKIYYQNKVFPRKIELLRYLTCFVFKSPKCKKIIEDFMKRHKLVFKKIKVKLNKWTN